METTKSRHYVVIDPYLRKLTLTYKGKVLAVSETSFIVKEVAKSVYNPVLYIPKEDLKITMNIDRQRSSYCPIKGDATYWNIDQGPTTDYFAWSYETPLPRAKKIGGYIAFNMAYITLLSEPL